MKKRVGYFAAQEAALFKKFKLRRIQGLAIDGEWFKTEMKILVQESDNPLKDQFKGSDQWLSKFCRRNGLSSQRKTNKKSKSILERLPKIKNFHYYTVYKMGLEKFWAFFQLGFGAFNRACVICIKECNYTVFLPWKNYLISLTFSHLGDTRVILSKNVVQLQVSKKRELPVALFKCESLEVIFSLQ